MKDRNLRLAVTVLDQVTDKVVEHAEDLTVAEADRFIQQTYIANQDRPLTARIALDLNDTCLEW